MSLLQSQTLYGAIETACVNAWNVSEVFYGKPQTPNPVFPYAVVALDTVAMAQSGVIVTEQTYSFTICYVALWNFTDVTFNLETAKQIAANQIITELMAGSTFAGIAYQPQITEVNFVEVDDPKKPWYEVYVTFACKCSVDTLVGE